MDKELESLYREEIINHYKYPHNWGEMDNADITVWANNPLCGDALILAFKLEDDKIKDVKINGTGCSISQASASMLSDYLIGKSIEEIKNIDSEFIFSLLKINLSSTRIKCALLPLEVISKIEK